MSLLPFLHEATLTQHRQTEQLAFGGQPLHMLDLAAYITLLQKNYVLHRALEQQFQAAVASFDATPLAAFIGQKSAWLAADLQALNANTLPTLTLTIAPPIYPTLAALTGGLYVSEGSTLGGLYIVKALKNNAEIAATNAFQFYEGYGKTTGNRWRDFAKTAQDILSDEAAKATAIEAAQRTFAFFGEVYAGK